MEKTRRGTKNAKPFVFVTNFYTRVLTHFKCATNPKSVINQAHARPTQNHFYGLHLSNLMEHGRLRGAVFPSSNILALCNNAPIVRGEGGVRTGWRSALHSDTKLNTKSGLHLLGPCVGEKARCRVGLRLSLHPAHLPSQKTNVLFMKANELAPAFPFPYSFFDPSSLSWLLSKTLN